MKFLCAGMFPALQRTMTLTSLKTGTVNRVRSVTESVGGKPVNTARVLKTLGADPVLFGFAGGDNRTTVERLLEEEGIIHRFVRTSAPVRLAQTLLADDAADFTELVEEGPVLTAGDWQRFQAAFADIVTGNLTTVVLSGTLPAHAPVNAYAQMLAAAPGNTPIILDTAGPALIAALPFKPALVKINANELFQTTGTATNGNISGAEIEKAARVLISSGADAVGVTQGGNNAWLVTRHDTKRFVIPAVTVISTLGCGDAVNAGIAFSLRRCRDMERAFAFGLACGVSNAMHRLPGMIDPSQTDAIAARIIAEPHRSARKPAAAPPA